LLELEFAVPSPTPDKRAHERVAFFLVPVEREQLPVWVFVPDNTGSRHVGVIVNMSEGGLQVLTSAEHPLDGDEFGLSLIIGGPSSQLPTFSGRVRRHWTRPMGKLGQLSGMSLMDADSEAAEFLRMAAPSPQSRNWVRCLLDPRAASVGRSA
jgi:hypothetical protein